MNAWVEAAKRQVLDDPGCATCDWTLGRIVRAAEIAEEEDGDRNAVCFLLFCDDVGWPHCHGSLLAHVEGARAIECTQGSYCSVPEGMDVYEREGSGPQRLVSREELHQGAGSCTTMLHDACPTCGAPGMG